MEDLFKKFALSQATGRDVTKANNSLYCAESIKTYKMIVGELPPDPCNQVVRMYFAYQGDADRYSQIKIDKIDSDELACLVHGIYFNLSFAYWCYEHILENEKIQVAVSAKLIMNNDLRFVHPKIYCIWYPDLAEEETYSQLLVHKPELKYHVGIACSLAGYTKLFKQLDVLPDINMLSNAKILGHHDIFDHIRQKINEEGHVWNCMNDDYGYITTDVKCLKDTPLITQSTTERYKALYEVNTEVTSYQEEFSSSDFYCAYQYEDPLKTSVIRDNVVRAKINAIRSNKSLV